MEYIVPQGHLELNVLKVTMEIKIGRNVQTDFEKYV